MKILLAKRILAAVLLLALPLSAVNAGEKAFPKIVPALEGAPPEGFTIGKGHTAYNGSIDGSIYKVDLRNGQGEILVPAEPDFDVFAGDCNKLGMRVDPRSNYLFVAGCVNGDAYVFDADSGEEIEHFQLGPEGEFALPNDLAVTRDAVYFTDSYLPLIYRLPLSKNGKLPAGDDITAIQLPDEFTLDPASDSCCGGNGIVATPDGKTLIVGHSNLSRLYRVDPATGAANEIIVEPPLGGFLDGIVLHDGVLFILTPDDSGAYPPADRIQVVILDEDMLTGSLVGTVTDTYMDGVASGAMQGDSLYVNNARYFDFPGVPTEYWITKLDIYDVE